MTIKEIKEVIEFRYDKISKELEKALNDKNEYLVKYYQGQINMLLTLKHDINLNMTASFLEALYEAN